MEIDSGDAKAASEVLGMIADSAGYVGTAADALCPGVGSTIGTIVKYTLKVVAKLVIWSGGEPDNLGQVDLSWTYDLLQREVAVGQPRREKLKLYNDGSTGSYELEYDIERFETP